MQYNVRADIDMVKKKNQTKINFFRKRSKININKPIKITVVEISEEPPFSMC